MTNILTNRWIQAVGAITVLGVGFFAYQANNTTEELTAENEVLIEAVDVNKATNKSGDETPVTVETINNTVETDNTNSAVETSTTEK
jgi:hypothetical protein